MACVLCCVVCVHVRTPFIVRDVEEENVTVENPPLSLFQKIQQICENENVNSVFSMVEVSSNK